MNKTHHIIACVVLSVSSVYGQSSFTNLNFESANIPPGTQGNTLLPSSEAIPGWSASAANGSGSSVYYDSSSEGGSIVSINDSMTGSFNTFFSFTPLQGSFSVVLFAGPDGPANTASISQTGLVPAGTKSIDMDIAFPYGTAYAGTGFTVSLGGQQIAMTPQQVLANYTIYGGNLPGGLAGNSEQLTITQFPPAPPHRPTIGLGVG